MTDSKKPDSKAPDDSPDYTRLPESIDVSATVASQETAPPPDPESGKNTDTEFMIRYAG
jgi:hypothetical protein